MESFTRVFPLDFVAIRNVLIVSGLLVAAFAALAGVLWQLRNRRESDKEPWPRRSPCGSRAR
jgi:hypothetical protein